MSTRSITHKIKKGYFEHIPYHGFKAKETTKNSLIVNQCLEFTKLKKVNKCY